MLFYMDKTSDVQNVIEIHKEKMFFFMKCETLNDKTHLNELEKG